MTKLLAPALAASVLVGGAAACTDDEPDAAPTPTTTEPSTTTTEAAPTDEEAIEQLIADWFEQSRRIVIGDADVATAEDYLLDPYLSTYQAGIADRERAGQLNGELDDKSRVEIESVVVTGDGAVVVQCSIDADRLMLEESNQVIDGGTYASRATTDAVRTSDGWRLSGRETTARWEDRDSCDE